MAIFSIVPSIFGLEIFKHNETKSFPTKPQIWSFATYADGTLIIRIVYRHPNVTSTSNTVTFYPHLSLRIIHPNETVTEMDIDLGIQDFNWNVQQRTIGDYLDPVTIYPLKKGYVLVKYLNASDPSNYSTYNEWGCIIDWNGNEYR